MKPRSKRLVIVGVIAIASIAIWIVLSLRNGDSSLRVSLRAIAKEMGWSAPETTVEVVTRMSKDEKRGKNDDAIGIGITWTQKHPDDPSNYWIYTSISQLYLKKAQNDAGHESGYVNQAILYRDKALPFQEHNILGLQDLAIISEMAGDLSSSQRCPQYQNAIKLLQHAVFVLNEQRTEATKQQARSNDALTPDKIKTLSEHIDGTITRVTGKLQSSGCQ